MAKRDPTLVENLPDKLCSYVGHKPCTDLAMAESEHCNTHAIYLKWRQRVPDGDPNQCVRVIGRTGKQCTRVRYTSPYGDSIHCIVCYYYLNLNLDEQVDDAIQTNTIQTSILSEETCSFVGRKPCTDRAIVGSEHCKKHINYLKLIQTVPEGDKNQCAYITNSTGKRCNRVRYCDQVYCASHHYLKRSTDPNNGKRKCFQCAIDAVKNSKYCSDHKSKKAKRKRTFAAKALLTLEDGFM